jgi:CheY-like chemotaxis protein
MDISDDKILHDILNGKNVLIIDDDEFSRLLLDKFMTKLGANCDMLSHGSDVVELLKQKDVALVLLDIKMPGLNGFEVLQEIRKAGYKMPVVAQTAYAFHDDKITIKEKGFDGYTEKPIRRERLLRELIRVFDMKNA